MPGPGWHTVELHLAVSPVAGGLGSVEVWLDGVLCRTCRATRSTSAVFPGCCRSATRPAAPGTWPSTTRPWHQQDRTLRRRDSSDGADVGTRTTTSAFSYGRLVGCDQPTPASPATTSTATGPPRRSTRGQRSRSTTALPSSTYHYAVLGPRPGSNVSPLTDVAAATTPAAAAPHSPTASRPATLAAGPPARVSPCSRPACRVATRPRAAARRASPGRRGRWPPPLRGARPTHGWRSWCRARARRRPCCGCATHRPVRGAHVAPHCRGPAELRFARARSRQPTQTSTSPGNGWHVVELHLEGSGSAPGHSAPSRWADGGLVADLRGTAHRRRVVADRDAPRSRHGEQRHRHRLGRRFDDAGSAPSGSAPPATLRAHVPGNVSAVAGSPSLCTSAGTHRRTTPA